MSDSTQTVTAKQLEIKRINNAKVQTIPRLGGEDKRPIKGYELIPQLYGNIYLVAKKNSGKTTLIWNILNRCAGRDTIIIAFVSTLNNDDNWKMIKEKCEEKNLAFVGYTSIMSDDGVDQLEALVKNLQQNEGGGVDQEDDAMDQEGAGAPERKFSIIRYGQTGGAQKPTRKPRKLSYQAPKYIIILDDLSDELKKKSVPALLKKNRHFKCKVIISSQ